MFLNHCSDTEVLIDREFQPLTIDNGGIVIQYFQIRIVCNLVKDMEAVVSLCTHCPCFKVLLSQVYKMLPKETW